MTELLQSWAAQIAETPPGAGGWADDAEQRDEFIDRVCEISSAHVQLSARQWDRIVRHAAIEGGEILSCEDLTLHRRLQFLRAVASLVMKVGQNEDSRPSGVQTMWDTVIEVGGEEWPVELRNAMFDILSEQLRERSHSLQLGALYGFERLGDPRAREVIVRERSAFVDDDIREYASAVEKNVE